MRKNRFSEWVGFLLGIAICFSPIIYFYIGDPTILYEGIGLFAVTIAASPFFGWIGFVVGRAFSRR